MCSYEDKAVLGNPLTKWEGGIYSGERKTAVGDTLSHTGSGRPTVSGSPRGVGRPIGVGRPRPLDITENTMN